MRRRRGRQPPRHGVINKRQTDKDDRGPNRFRPSASDCQFPPPVRAFSPERRPPMTGSTTWCTFLIGALSIAGIACNDRHDPVGPTVPGNPPPPAPVVSSI